MLNQRLIILILGVSLLVVVGLLLANIEFSISASISRTTPLPTVTVDAPAIEVLGGLG